MFPKRLSFAPPIWGALFTGLLLLWWSPPSGWWKDGGQLVSASFGLGIAHPSGFPSYLLLSKTLGFLPLGPIAFRVQLLSILSSMMTIGLSWSVLSARLAESSQGLKWAVGIPVTVSLLAAHLFVLHGTTPEVYAPTLFALSGLVYTAHSSHENERKAVLFMALWTGLGLGFHFSAMAVSASAVWAVKLLTLSRDIGAKNMLKHASTAGLVIVLSMLAYGYIPLATQHDPWRNWGNPDTLFGLWNHILASSIRAAFSEDMLGQSVEKILTFGSLHISALWESVGLLTIFAPVGAVFTIYRKNRWSRLATSLLLIIVADSLFTIFINPMGIDDRQTGLHACWAICVLSGILLLVIVEESKKNTGIGRLAIFTALICSLGQGFSRGDSVRTLDRSDVGFPERFGTTLLRDVPPNALVVTGGDDTLGILNQALGVDGSRPDVALIALPHIYSVAELEHWARLYGTEVIPDDLLLHSSDNASPEGWIDSTIQLAWVKHFVEYSKRPVFWGPGEQEFDRMVAPHIRSTFPLSQISGPGTAKEATASGREFHRIISNWELGQERPMDLISLQSMAEQARFQARFALDQGRLEDANDLLTIGLDYNPSSYRAWTDMSAIRLRGGNIKGATSANRIAVNLRPDLPVPRMRLMEGLMKLGEFPQMKDHLAILETLDCDIEQLKMARILTARAHIALNEINQAVEVLARNIAELPGDQESLDLLNSIRSEK